MNNENTPIKRESKSIVGAVLVILIILTVISAVLLGFRLSEYVKTDGRELLLQSDLDAELEIFSVQYENERGEVTVSGAGEKKVVAPGTAVSYTVRLRNADKTAVDYFLIPRASLSGGHPIPIDVRMLDYDGNYVIGSASEWVGIGDIRDVCAQGTLAKGEATEYIFEWKWDFEAGRDEYDTFLGTLAGKEELALSLNFELRAEANTDIGTNGGFMRSGIGDIFSAGLAFLLLLASVLLLTVYLVKKRGGAGS